jgi:hypothetical protein
MADKTTKLLLGLITLGIWLNLVGMFRITRMTDQIRTTLSDTNTDVGQLETDLTSIEDGSCENGFLCP